MLRKLRRKPVVSRSIRSAGYDPAHHELELEYMSGRVYRYFDVPPETHTAFEQAESKGRFVNEHIRTFYRYQQLS